MFSRLERFRLRKGPQEIASALRSAIQTASRSVPAYRRLLAEVNVSADDIRTPEDLPSLPILSKENLFRTATLADALRQGTNPRRCIAVGTSGSTGLPLTVYMSRAETLYRRLLLVRAWRRVCRLPLGSSIVDLGSWLENGEASKTHIRGPFRIVRVSIGVSPENQISLIRRAAPALVSGYPSALEILADEMLAARRPLAVGHIVARGEVLHAAARRKIEEAFCCGVSDFYNSEEIGNIAWECPANPGLLHINQDACIVEVVDANGQPCLPGVEGRVLVTNLYNHTMPFIRYEMNDRVAFQPGQTAACTCGSRGPVIRALSGRDDDRVLLPDGRHVSPRLVATAVNRAFSGLSPEGPFSRFYRRFQVVQDAPEHLSVRIIPEPGVMLDFAAIIGPALRRLHPDLRLDVQLTDTLESGPSGKFKKVIRRIGSSPDCEDIS